jgi:hypothetical protein
MGRKVERRIGIQTKMLDPDPKNAMKNTPDPDTGTGTNLGGGAVGTAADDSGQRNGEKGGEEDRYSDENAGSGSEKRYEKHSGS